MTVEQYVMLMTAWSVIKTKEGDSSYKYAGAIPSIICKDGYKISVQCHGGVHCKFEGISQDDLSYSFTFGEKLLMAETNCEDLNQYGIDTIEDIENYVNSHGGIDVEKTVDSVVRTAICKLKN